MASVKRLGIYGGTFSPPHKGHVNAGLAFLRQLKLDRVMVMPARIPPHKPDSGMDPMHRLRMTQLAFADAPEYGDTLFVSDWEISRQAVSYTVDTLRFFRLQGFELYFLCGTDMFLSLDRWRDPAGIFSLATVAYVRREEESPAVCHQIQDALYHYRMKYDAKPVEIITEPVEISSTALRNKLIDGECVEEWIPLAVQDYIKQNGLYVPQTGGELHD